MVASSLGLLENTELDDNSFALLKLLGSIFKAVCWGRADLRRPLGYWRNNLCLMWSLVFEITIRNVR